VRCGKCGNENPDSNRFCGMCGTALVQAVPAKATSEQARTPAPLGEVRATPWPSTAPAWPTREATRGFPEEAGAPAERPPQFPRDNVSPTIVGPSFLGLNKPAPGTSPTLGRRDGPHGSSRDLSYLLEDEEEPKRGWGKVILIVIFLALALAGGFGYLHWKQEVLDWLNIGGNKPVTQAPAADANGAPSASAAPSAAGEPAPSQLGGTAPAPASNTPNASPTPTATSPQSSSAAPAETTAAPAATAPSTDSSQTKSGDTNAPTQPSPPPKADTGSDDEPVAKEPANTQTATPREAANPGVARAATAKPPAAKPVDAVAEAERYIYGRGVRQDCDRGLRLLKPAAAQSNAAAMISLGAMYSTGTCTPRDLPTAYRWFALALHKQPENQPLQDDLQKLWSQMTQPERQLAIKLSQ
jgi:zinc-ribbon domain/Sel1 repeat